MAAKIQLNPLIIYPVFDIYLLIFRIFDIKIKGSIN